MTSKRRARRFSKLVARAFRVLFRHLKAELLTHGEGWKTLLQHSSESPLFAHRRTHRTGFKGVSRYAYGYAPEARVVVAYREIEHRGTFYLEQLVAASSSSSSSSGDFIARVE